MFNKDFGKQAKGLLNDDFPGKFDFELESSFDDFSVSTEMKLGDDGTFSTSVSPKFKLFKEVNFEGEFDTEGSCSYKFINSDYLVNGLKSSATVDFEQKEDEKSCCPQLTLAEDYKHDDFTASLKLVFPTCSKFTPPTTTLGLVYSKNKVAVGVEGVVKPSDEKPLQKVSGNVQYTDDKYTVSAGGVLSKGVLNGVLRFFSKGTDFDFGAELNWGGDDQTLSGNVGFRKNLVSGGIAKLVLESSGSIGVAYKKSLCTSTDFSVGTKVDFDTLEHSTGVSVSYDC